RSPGADVGESSSLDANAPTRWRFDGYELDLRARELRDPQGARLAIEARSFDLLALLIRERERALDKQELLDRVWNGRIVTDASITQAVFKLRRLNTACVIEASVTMRPFQTRSSSSCLSSARSRSRINSASRSKLRASIARRAPCGSRSSRARRSSS